MSLSGDLLYSRQRSLWFRFTRYLTSGRKEQRVGVPILLKPGRESRDINLWIPACSGIPIGRPWWNFWNWITLLFLGWSGRSAGLLDQGKVSQNRVKKGKKRSWDKRNLRETAWQNFDVYTLMQKDRHSYLCHGRIRTCSALESKRTGSLDVS